MLISEEINAIRDKYKPDYLKAPYKYQINDICKNEFMLCHDIGICTKCGLCGREFDEKGKIKKYAEGESK